MKHINFIPTELRPKLEIPGVLIPAGLFLALLLYVSGSVVWGTIAIKQSQAELARVEAESAELTQKIESLPGSKLNSKQDDSMGSLKKVLAKKNYWSAIFREMSVLMPDGVWLTSFSDHSSRTPAQLKSASEVLLIKGESSSQDVIAQFLISLEKSQHFTGVQLMFSEKESNIRPARYKFEFSIPVKVVTNGSGS